MQSFLAKHQITHVIQLLYSPDLVPCNFWPSQTNITFEREEISDHQWDSGKYNRAADGDWENCVRSQGAWDIIVLCTMFPVSCIFFNKCLQFSYYMAGYLLDRLYLNWLTRIQIDRDSSMVTARGKEWGEVGSGLRGDKWGWKDDFGWWTHDAAYRQRVTELCTWHLCGFINKCHPKKCNKK